MKAKYSDVKHLRDNTNWDNKVFEGDNSQPFVDEYAYFAPSDTNWCYRFGIAKGIDNKLYHVVTVYGEVKGYRSIHA